MKTIVSGVLLAGAVGLAVSAPVSAAALTLEEAMEAAASATESGALLELSIDAATANVKTQLGELLPTLAATGTLTRNQREVSFNDRVVTDLWQRSGSVTLAADLIRLPAIPEYRAARIGADATELEATAGGAQLRLAAGRAYLLALAGAARLEAATESQVARRASLERAQALIETGYAVDADLARAELAMLEAENDALVARYAVEDALALLAYLVGREDLAISELSEPSAVPGQGEGERATMFALDRRIDQFDTLLRARRFDLLPTLRLAGTYSAQSGSSFSSSSDPTWTLRFTLDWTLFDYSRYGRIDAAGVARDEATLRLSLEEREQSRAIDEARRAVELAQASEALAAAAIDVAMRSQSQVAELYSAGDVTILEMTEADTALFDARVSLVARRLERGLAELELAWQTGGLDDETGE